MKLSLRPRKWLIAAPVLLGFAVLALMLLNRAEPERDVRHEEVRTFRVIRTSAVDVVPRILGYGTAQPSQVWRAVSEVEGRVIEVHPQLIPDSGGHRMG